MPSNKRHAHTNGVFRAQSLVKFLHRNVICDQRCLGLRVGLAGDHMYSKDLAQPWVKTLKWDILVS